MILRELKAQNVHIAVKEKYVIDREGNKTDRIIECIAWWTPEQIRIARRFVSRSLAQTDGTFNTNEKRLLLQCFISVDNTGKTFQFLQAFSTAESAEIIRFLLQILEDHYFYDCPGFVVLIGDFSTGLSAGFAQKAVEDTKRAQKGKPKQCDLSSDKLQIEHYPLPTAPSRPKYEADSQTIIVDSDPDWPRAVQPIVRGVNIEVIILQYCTQHTAEAIKRKLIHSGYKKEHRNKIIDLIWKWIEAPTLDILDTARDSLILALKSDEKEYLTGWYQPKESQFCKAYTCQYRNLETYATQCIERNHFTVSQPLHKNLRVAEAIERICNYINSLTSDYKQRLSPSRITIPRLFDQDFFSLVARRITLFALEKCGPELMKAKQFYEHIVTSDINNIFDPKVGYQEGCSLPLQYQLPCKHWICYFYCNNKPIPINLFHPRWLIDSPSVIRLHQQIRLDNYDFSKGEPIEERHIGDRFAGTGEQLIVDTAIIIVERLKNLPPSEKEPFALTFKKMSDSLISQHDKKLERLETFPRRLPNPLIQPKVTFVPGRKRVLTGIESAQLQEEEATRRRRQAQIQGQKQAQDNTRQANYTAEVSRRQDEVAEEYNISRKVTDDDSVSSDSDEFLDIDKILSQRKPLQKQATPPLITPTSSRLVRTQKPTSKQASQNRREIKKQEKKKAQLKKTVDTTQQEEFELPFRSSQQVCNSSRFRILTNYMLYADRRVFTCKVKNILQKLQSQYTLRVGNRVQDQGLNLGLEYNFIFTQFGSAATLHSGCENGCKVTCVLQGNQGLLQVTLQPAEFPIWLVLGRWVWTAPRRLALMLHILVSDASGEEEDHNHGTRKIVYTQYFVTLTSCRGVKLTGTPSLLQMRCSSRHASHKRDSRQSLAICLAVRLGLGDCGSFVGVMTILECNSGFGGRALTEGRQLWSHAVTSSLRSQQMEQSGSAVSPW